MRHRRGRISRTNNLRTICKRRRPLQALASLLVLAALLVASSTPADAAGGTTLYVDNTTSSCRDSGSGTQSQPLCTIGAANARALPGTTVQVAAGTYNEKITVKSAGTATQPIVFTAAPGATVTMSNQASAFVVSGKSYVTINGFNVTHETSYGIDVTTGSSNVTVSNNHVSYSGTPASGLAKYGIRVNAATDSVISGNTVDHNSDTGIALVGSSQRIQVLNNECYANARSFERAAAGIRVASASDNTIAGNRSHDNEDSGIESYPGAVNTLIYDNVLYNNGDHGSDNFGTTNQRIFANTVYNNVTAGINVEGNSTGAVVENNISVDNGIGSPRTHSEIRVERGSTTGAIVDSNLVWLNTNDVLYIWNSVNYSTLAQFRAASGQGAHDIWADPRWRNMAARDFHLLWNSPAVDSADSSANGQPPVDFDGALRTDDPLVANSGLGPVPYMDRGAFEIQPADMDAAPTARLALTPSSGVFPLTVTADASASTDPDPTPIASYTFDFGDGTVTGPQSAPTAQHTYAAEGVYTVTVTTADTGGQMATSSQQVTVVDRPPAASLSITPAFGSAPLSVSADASASTDTDPSPIASYTFDFGDGTVTGPQAAPTTTHVYGTKGTYTLRVTVTDTNGHSGSATATVPVAGDEPVPALTVTPPSGLAPLGVTADASASWDTDSTPIARYTFDWGDGSSTGAQAGATAAHTYAAAGTYTIQVTVTDTGGLSSVATSTVTVVDAPPTASLSLASASGQAPLAVTADASASSDPDATPIATYAFDWGDGASTPAQPGPTAAHTYTTEGAFTVTLTVTDTANKTATTTQQVVVGAPTASLTVTPTSGITPVTVTADASASSDPGPSPIAAYTFDFGDGTTAGPQAAPTAAHTYTTGGTFSVKVTVRDTIDLASTATAQVAVKLNRVKNAGFETDTSGWNTSGSGDATSITLARVAGGHSGSSAAQLTNTAATPVSCLLNDSPDSVPSTAAATYTGSLWVRADAPGAALKLRFREFNGGVLTSTAITSVALTTDWQQVTVSDATTAGSTLDFNAYVVNAPPGTCFYADDAAVTSG
jgi:parallel beta-helix repeat protein